MKRPENLQYRTGTIADLEVNFPAPYAVGHVVNEGEAAILNQTLKENIANNLRKRIEAGYVATEGAEAIPHTSESAQRLIDEYFDSYEPGVRRGGSGEPRVTDPVEKEARKLARSSAVEFVKQRGAKPADVDMGEITNALFEANREVFMKEGKKIVDQQKKATSAVSFEGIDLTPKAAEQPAGDEAAAA